MKINAAKGCPRKGIRLNAPKVVRITLCRDQQAQLIYLPFNIFIATMKRTFMNQYP